MPWDLTPDEAGKVKRLLSGESVDLTEEEAAKFKPIALEAAQKKQQPAQPSLGSQAWEALKEIGSNLVTPQHDESTSGPMADAQFKALSALGSMDIGFRPAPLTASSSPQEMERQRRKSAESVDMLMEEGRMRNPKTALAAGILAPFPTKIKEQMLTAGGMGALHGWQHAPGDVLDTLTKEGVGPALDVAAGKGKAAAVSGGINALVAAGLGLGMKGTGKILGPAARKLMQRLGLKELPAEPLTMPEHPMDVAAREQAAMAARGGEPPTMVDPAMQPRPDYASVATPEPTAEVDATRVRFPGEPRILERLRQEMPTRAGVGGPPREPVTVTSPPRPGLSRDRLETNPGFSQRARELLAEEPRTDLLPEPEVTRSGRVSGEPTVVDRPALNAMEYRAQRAASRGRPQSAEPQTNVTKMQYPPFRDAEPVTDIRPVSDAQHAAEIAAVEAKARELGGERKTKVDADPRFEENLRESGFYEAADAANRGNPELMVKWLKDNPYMVKFHEQQALLHARGHREVFAHRAQTAVDPSTNVQPGRDLEGTAASGPKAIERSLGARAPSVDEGLAWLEGEDLGTADTKVKYVPKDVNAPKVFGRDPEATHVPQGRAPGAEMFVGGGAGSGPPRAAAATHAGPPVSAPLSPQQIPANYWQLAHASQELLKKSENWFGRHGKLDRKLNLPEFRGSEMLGHAVLSFKASQALGEMRVKHFFPKMEAALKGLPVATRATVKETIRKLRDRQATMADVNKLPTEFRDLFLQAQREQNAQLTELAKNGYFAPQELAGIVSNMRKGWLYAHRSYHAFTSPKTWEPDVKAHDMAARFFMKNQKGLSYENALGLVRGLVKDIKDPNKSGLRGAEMLTALLRDRGMVKGRTLPPQLRPLLGVIDDPSFIAADTAGHMASMFHLMARTRALLSPEYQGKVWSDVPLPHLDERPLWIAELGPAGNKRVFGELAGKYVDPALREAMTEAPPQVMEEVANQFFKKVNGWFAMSKVLTSPTTWARNFLSNGLYLAASGLSNPLKQAQYVGRAMRALYAVANKGMGAGEAGANDLVQMAIEDGALRLGRGTDFAGGSEARRIVELALAKQHDGMLGMMDNVFKGLTKAKGRLGDAYEFFDQSARLAAYLFHLEAGRKSLQMKPMEARAHASHIVNRYFATGAGVPPALARFKQYTLGAAPFMNWFVDNARVATNIMVDAATSFRDPKKIAPLMRAAAWSSIPWLAFKGAQIWNGFTDEDNEAAMRAVGSRWEAEHAFNAVLPVKRADGSMYVVSFDGLNPMSVFFKGPQQMNPAQRVAASVATGMVDSGALEPAMGRLLDQAGIKPEEYKPKTLHGDQGWALARGITDFMEPQLMSQYQNMARKAQLAGADPLRRTEEPESGLEAFLTSFSPVTIKKVGGHTLRGARAQLQAEKAELFRERRAAKKIQDPDRKERVIEGVRGAFEDFRERVRNR